MVNTTTPWAGIEARPKPNRDRYGRYLIPDMETGELMPHTRATTFAGLLADTFALTRWQVRMTALGLAQRADLLARIASTHPDERSELDGLCEEAKEHAGAMTGANLGTALHAFTEVVDLGEARTVVPIPEPYAADVAAYTSTMSGAGMTIEAVEQIVVLNQLGEPVAGTFDRIVWNRANRRRLIADLKTGKSLDHAWPEIAIQLALYAHGIAIWDPGSNRFLPMPEVDQSEALVMHLPVGQARCDLYLVDIAAGWAMVETCTRVRAWRKRKNLASLVTGPLGSPVPAGGGIAPPMLDPPAGSAAGPSHDAAAGEDRRAWLRSRILALTPAGREVLLAAWPEVPRLSEAGPEHFDAIAAAVSAAEKATGAPFPETGDPGMVGVTDARRSELRERLAALPADLVPHGVDEQLRARSPIPLPEWDTIDALIADAEGAHADRMSELIVVGNLVNTPEANQALLTALGIRSMGVACAWDVASAHDLLRAMDAGLLVVRHARLAVERPLTVLDGYRRRERLLEVAKDLAVARHRPVPRSSTQALEDPVLVAALAASLPEEEDA